MKIRMLEKRLQERGTAATLLWRSTVPLEHVRLLSGRGVRLGTLEEV